MYSPILLRILWLITFVVLLWFGVTRVGAASPCRDELRVIHELIQGRDLLEAEQRLNRIEDDLALFRPVDQFEAQILRARLKKERGEVETGINLLRSTLLEFDRKLLDSRLRPSGDGYDTAYQTLSSWLNDLGRHDAARTALLRELSRHGFNPKIQVLLIQTLLGKYDYIAQTENRRDQRVLLEAQSFLDELKSRLGDVEFRAYEGLANRVRSLIETTSVVDHIARERAIRRAQFNHYVYDQALMMMWEFRERKTLETWEEVSLVFEDLTTSQIKSLSGKTKELFGELKPFFRTSQIDRALALVETYTIVPWQNEARELEGYLRTHPSRSEVIALHFKSLLETASRVGTADYPFMAGSIRTAHGLYHQIDNLLTLWLPRKGSGRVLKKEIETKLEYFKKEALIVEAISEEKQLFERDELASAMTTIDLIVSSLIEQIEALPSDLKWKAAKTLAIYSKTKQREEAARRLFERSYFYLYDYADQIVERQMQGSPLTEAERRFLSEEREVAASFLVAQIRVR